MSHFRLLFVVCELRRAVDTEPVRCQAHVRGEADKKQKRRIQRPPNQDTRSHRHPKFHVHLDEEQLPANAPLPVQADARATDHLGEGPWAVVYE